MMLKTSSGKLNPTRSLFLHFLKKQTPITSLVTAFSLLICPGALISQLVQSYEYTYDTEIRQELINDSVNYTLFSVVIAGLLIVFLLLMNFRFLYSKRAGDMYYTLPTTRNEMLFSGFTSAFLGGIFSLTIGIGSLILINLLPMWDGVAITEFLKIYFLSVFFLLFLSAFSLIFIVAGGREFDAIISLIGVSVGIPAIYLIANYMYHTFAYGVPSSEDYELIYTSPFIYVGAKLLTHILNINVDEREYAEISSMLKLNWFSFLSVSVLTIVCFFVVVKLFKIRRSESAEQGYSFKFMPAILLSLCAVVGGFVIGLILSAGSPFTSLLFWLFYGIGALLCGVAFEAVHTRGFKTVKSAIAKGGIAIAVSVAIMASAGVLGAKEIYYIPDDSEIEKIIVSGEAEFTENFDTVRKLHKAVLDEYDKYGGTNGNWTLLGEYYTGEHKPGSDFAYQVNDIYFEYQLKNGKVVLRNYDIWRIDYNEIKRELYDLLASDEVKTGYYKELLKMEESGGIYGEFNRSDNDFYNGTLTLDSAKLIIDTYMEELRTADLIIFEENCRHINFSSYDGYWMTLRVPYSFTETIDMISLLLVKTEYY